MSSDTSTLPTEIKVIDLAIGVSDNTNDTLNFDSSQYLIVGEKTDNYGSYSSNIYSLLVDEQGVAINTSFNAKSNIDTTSALVVDGNVYISGNILGPAWGNLVGSNFIASNTYIYASPSDYNNGILNLYTEGNFTLGNLTSATGNSNTFNIVKNNNSYSINNAQFSLQNLQQSQFRMAIIGNSQVSPIIMNTPSGAGPIEFHMSRDQSYFSNTYIYNGIYNDVPTYDSKNTDAPHIRIDQAGNVGIKTSVNRPLTFNIRVPNTPTTYQYNTYNQPADLHVEGTLYASNIVINDYYNNSAKSLDDVYIRQLGASIPAADIIPGTFTAGDFIFPCNVNILSNLNISQNLTVQGITCNIGYTYFKNDVDITGALLITGAFLKNYSNGVESNLTIQFQVAGAAASNINNFGLGITTPGVFGAGIYPSDSRYSSFINQIVSVKHNPSAWELELTDDSSNGFVKSAVFGHPTQDTTLPNFVNYGLTDGSLVIATPSTNDVNYVPSGASLPQNIYFFPGRDPSTVPFLTASAPPTLGIFSTNQVGINTYVPYDSYAFSVNGDISYSGNLYQSNQGTFSKIANFYEITRANPINNGPLNFTGITYNNCNAPYVGINTLPDPSYGLIVAGKLKSIDGYYTPDDHKMISWYDSSYLLPNGDISTAVQRSNIFTWGNVGIGVPISSSILSIKDNNGGNNSTTFNIIKSDTSYLNNIIFQGASTNQWNIQTDHNLNTFSIANDINPLSNLLNIRPFMIKQTQISNTPAQLYINTNAYGNLPNKTSPDPNASLTVGGNIAVMGDVNITGAFRINSIQLINSNVTSNTSNLNSANPYSSTDIVISGRNIQLDYNIERDPINTRSVVVGHPFPDINGNYPLITQVDQNTAFRVYSSYSATPGNNQLIPVATFQSAGSNSIIEMVALSNTLLNIDPRNQKAYFGVFTSNANQNYNFAILDGAYNPYLSFYNVPNSAARYTGINNYNPQAALHIQAAINDYGSNMFRLTKSIAGNSDTTSACPSIDLQKTYTTRAPTSWTIAGPNAAWNQKLSFIYTDSNILPNTSNEIYTFTNNGCIGIGTSQPQFSIDVVNSNAVGGIRLWDYGNTGKPQILFQTGTDDIFGDNTTQGDYRMGTYNGIFSFDTQQNSTPVVNILKAFPTGHVGICTDPVSAYTVNVLSSLNVGEQLYINGIPVVGSTSSQSNINFNAPNISFNSYSLANPTGSVNINSSANGTSNLFYIHSGANQNMLVLDSSFPQAQIHFRTTEPNSSRTDVFRMDANTSNFEWKYYPNYTAPIPTSPFYFNDCNTGYTNAFSFGVSQRADGLINGDFDTNVYGSLLLNSVTPNIIFGVSNYNSGALPQIPAPCISASNNALIFVATCNIGIGTYYPQGILSIYNSNQTYTNSNSIVRIDQYGTGDILDIYNQGTLAVTITSNGSVGIGTNNPNALLTVVASNTIPLSSNTPSSNVPIAFAVQQQGQYGNIAHFYNYCNEGLIINNVGYLGINTLFPQSNLHVIGNGLINGYFNVTSNVYMGANIEIFGNAVSHGNNITDSDKRIKKDLERIENGLEKVKKLTGYTFTNIRNGTRNTGLIAQDVDEILPEAVYKDGEHLGLAYGNLMGLVVEAIKELSDKVDSIHEYINNKK